jgi:hypothetical protein
MSTSKWYNKKSIVILLLFVFFPVGLYGLWKGSSFGKVGKFALTAVLAVLFIITIAGGKKQPERATANETAAPSAAYSITTSAKENGDKVEIAINTNLPTPFTCFISVDTKHPKKDKTFIGVFDNKIIEHQSSVQVLDLISSTYPQERLPNGTYTVECQANPLNDANKSNKIVAGLKSPISGSCTIEIKNGSTTVEYIDSRNDCRESIQELTKIDKS